MDARSTGAASTKDGFEVPTRLHEGRRVPIGIEDVRLEYYQQISNRQADDFGRVWPDAAIALTSLDGGGETDVRVELARTDRPSRNFHKFRHYDALITAWWRTVPRYRQIGEAPAAVFVCSDEAHAFGFKEAADRHVAGRVADRARRTAAGRIQAASAPSS
jgi:hypothetical protein